MVCALLYCRWMEARRQGPIVCPDLRADPSPRDAREASEEGVHARKRIAKSHDVEIPRAPLVDCTVFEVRQIGESDMNPGQGARGDRREYVDDAGIAMGVGGPLPRRIVDVELCGVHLG